MNEKNTTNGDEVFKLRNEIRDLNQSKTTMQTTINNRNSEISRLNNIINDKGREIGRFQTSYDDSQKECQNLQKILIYEAVSLIDKGDYYKTKRCPFTKKKNQFFF